MTASNIDPSGSAPRQIQAMGEKVSAEWWRAFGSSDLDDLVAQALVGSQTLESAKARLEQAQAALASASGALYPQVNFNASAAREKLSASTFGLKPGAFPLPPNFNVFQLGPTVSYAPDLFGGTGRQIERQSALADYQQYQLNAAYLILIGKTVSQAIELAAIQGQLKAAHEILDIDQQNLTLVRKQRKAGAVPDVDVIIAESQLAADETALLPLEQQVSVSKHALAVLLGRPPGAWSPPDFDLGTLTLPGTLPISLPSELVHERPDILAAEAQLHAASAEIGIAAAKLYPSVTLSGGVTATGLDPSHLFSPAGLVWSIAAGLAQPIFDGGTRESERRAALAGFKASAADYQQTVLQAFGQVADIMQAEAHDAHLLASQQRALDLASESVRLQQYNYARGGTGLLSLLDAQRQYQKARLGFVQAQAQRYQDTVQLLVAMGGGSTGATFLATGTVASPNPIFAKE
jgi:NodT family efflux transporter outer membrane factor (OMF) lipoprotein